MHTYSVLVSRAASDSVDAIINVDNQLIFSGTVLFDKASDRIELCRWNREMPLSGNIQISGSVTTGDMHFCGLTEIVSYQAESESPDSLVESEYSLELEYPDTVPHMHAVTSININGFEHSIPFNIEKSNNDIRGWHYLITNNSNFEIVYFSGPFDEVASIDTTVVE